MRRSVCGDCTLYSAGGDLFPPSIISDRAAVVDGLVGRRTRAKVEWKGGREGLKSHATKVQSISASHVYLTLELNSRDWRKEAMPLNPATCNAIPLLVGMPPLVSRQVKIGLLLGTESLYMPTPLGLV